MRITQKRKRSGFTPFKRALKRRRFNRFKRKKRSNYTSTSRQLSGTNPFLPRARKLSKKRYRGTLWRDTVNDTHYKSVIVQAFNLVTPNGITTQLQVAREAISSANDSEFFTSGGGLQDPSFAVTPTWATIGARRPTTCIIRGGRLWFQASLGLGAVDTTRVRIQLIFTKSQTRSFDDGTTSNTLSSYLGATGLDISGTSRPSGLSITDLPDWEQYFYKPVVDKTYDMKAGDDVTVFWKIKPVKIDTKNFQEGGGNWFPYWFVYAYQLNNSNGASETVTCAYGHNLSFAVSGVGD